MIKCVCAACGAKYRLPVEFGGRTARCKKCGAKFEVPKEKGLEDSVLDWLAEGEEAEEAIEKPRVISMPPKSAAADDSDAGRKPQGVIRLKSGSTAPPKPH